MKIVFIVHQGFDYLQDLCYSGLKKILGTKLTEYPWRPPYHLPLKRYPKNLGFSWAPPHPRVRLKDTDVVMVGAAKPDAFHTYLRIGAHIPPQAKVVFIDGGDRAEIGGDLLRLGAGELYHKAMAIRPFDYVFKREYLREHDHGAKVFPLPFSFNFTRLPRRLAGEKRYEVAFWASNNVPIRDQVLRLIVDKYDCAQNGTTLHQTFAPIKRKGANYLKELQRCRIVLNFRGGGWDTMRYWETMAMGSFMISGEPRIRIPHQPIHEEHLIYCADNLEDLNERIQYYLTHEKQRERIAARGSRFIRAFHSDEQRARFIVATIG
jgi:hypothetical protein